jgi:hypothetical protein
VPHPFAFFANGWDTTNPSMPHPFALFAKGWDSTNITGPIRAIGIMERNLNHLQSYEFLSSPRLSADTVMKAIPMEPEAR